MPQFFFFFWLAHISVNNDEHLRRIMRHSKGRHGTKHKRRARLLIRTTNNNHFFCSTIFLCRFGGSGSQTYNAQQQRHSHWKIRSHVTRQRVERSLMNCTHTTVMCSFFLLDSYLATRLLLHGRGRCCCHRLQAFAAGVVGGIGRQTTRHSVHIDRFVVIVIVVLLVVLIGFFRRLVAGVVGGFVGGFFGGFFVGFAVVGLLMVWLRKKRTENIGCVARIGRFWKRWIPLFLALFLVLLLLRFSIFLLLLLFH